MIVEVGLCSKSYSSAFPVVIGGSVKRGEKSIFRIFFSNSITPGMGTVEGGPNQETVQIVCSLVHILLIRRLPRKIVR